MSTTHTQIALWTEEYAALRNEKEVIETRMNLLKEQLLMNVPAGESMLVGERKVTHTVAARTTLNTTLLKAELPTIYTKYSETKQVESLLVK